MLWFAVVLSCAQFAFVINSMWTETKWQMAFGAKFKPLPNCKSHQLWQTHLSYSCYARDKEEIEGLRAVVDSANVNSEIFSNNYNNANKLSEFRHTRRIHNAKITVCVCVFLSWQMDHLGFSFWLCLELTLRSVLPVRNFSSDSMPFKIIEMFCSASSHSAQERG